MNHDRLPSAPTQLLSVTDPMYPRKEQLKQLPLGTVRCAEKRFQVVVKCLPFAFDGLVDGKNYRKALFQPPTMGGSCRFSHQPLLGLVAGYQCHAECLSMSTCKSIRVWGWFWVCTYASACAQVCIFTNRCECNYVSQALIIIHVHLCTHTHIHIHL